MESLEINTLFALVFFMKMPTLFLGHGSPLNALENNEFTLKWKDLGKKIPRPKAILVISAHWITQGTLITASKELKTIHDFSGFPGELYAFKYKAKGSEELAQLIQKTIKTTSVKLDYEWGLDHGAWSVLAHLYPKADIPVLQLSLDSTLTSQQAFSLGKELEVLREEGILILGTGNIIHNLMLFHPEAKAFNWATSFDENVKKLLLKKEYDSLINFNRLAFIDLAQPTPDHYFPLLYILGAAGEDSPTLFNEKVIFGSVSMTSVGFGL